MIAPKLTDEMRCALAARDGGPTAVVDEQTGDQYALMPIDDYCRLSDDCIRSALRVSLDQVARGEVSELNMNEILAEAHRRHADRDR